MVEAHGCVPAGHYFDALAIPFGFEDDLAHVVRLFFPRRLAILLSPFDSCVLERL
jgi:hypothetical protein